MALLIFQENNPQAIIVKGTMEELEHILEQEGEPSHPQGIDFVDWNGVKVKFFNSHKWDRVEEWTDEAVKDNIKKAKKKAKEEKAAMKAQKEAIEKMQGKNITQKPNLFIPGRRGH